MQDSAPVQEQEQTNFGVSSTLPAVDAWSLTLAMTPRQAVRVLDGASARSYSTRSAEPALPWAMYLARRISRGVLAYRLLGFDFDAHTPDDGHDAAAHAEARAARRLAVLDDVAVLVDMLTRLRIPHVVCRSSSSGGHHVWVALAEDLSPAIARRIGETAKTVMPTLDAGMLSNPETGCLRPPLSPHRDGSRSELVAGTITTLLEPSTTVDDAIALQDALRAAQPAPALVPSATVRSSTRPAPTTPEETHGRLPVDATGHVYLPGAKRPLPGAAAAALAAPVRLLDDASARLMTILCGAARAHWRYDDVAALVDTAPGLERARTVRAGDLRVPRPATGHASSEATLRADWQRAVRHVASTPTSGAGDDETFTGRIALVTELAEYVQLRADAMPGRWDRHGGPADRRILDRLTTYALAGVTAAVEADVRRLAMDTGMGRETARTALLRLQADGWIERVAEADGARAARWLLAPQSIIHRGAGTGRSQAAIPARRRLDLLALLRQRTQLSTHDAFTYGALGLHAGNVYARIHEGHAPSPTDVGCRGLLEHGLVRLHGHRVQPGIDRRHAIARALGVAGRIDARARRYRLEREVWDWWLAELDWMRSRGRRKTARRSTAPALWSVSAGDHYPAMPRRAGRVRFDLAHAQTAAGLLTAAPLDPTLRAAA